MTDPAPAERPRAGSGGTNIAGKISCASSERVPTSHRTFGAPVINHGPYIGPNHIEPDFDRTVDLGAD
jgi:hypothetical protein